MAARGSEEKDLVTKQILEAFKGSFVYGKEIRIPVNDVQIKVALTCAKDNITIEGGVAPAEVYSDAGFPAVAGSSATAQTPVEPTEAELENVRMLAAKLGL